MSRLFYELSPYKKKEIILKLSDDEISDWYNTNKSKYIRPIGVNVSVFTFDSRQNAGLGIINIKQNHNDTSRLSTLKGLRNVERNFNIVYTKPIFSSVVMERLRSIGNSQILPAGESGDNYSVIVKNYDYGQREMQLDEVKEEIVQEIEAKKLLEIKQIQLHILKAKYSCTNRIEYGKYL